jgi:hypothetical protein
VLLSSFREHPRAWLLVLGPVLLALETACNGTPAKTSSSQRQLSKKAAREAIKNGDKTVTAWRGGVKVDVNEALKSSLATSKPVRRGDLVYGSYKGKVAMQAPSRVPSLSHFGAGRFVAGAKAGYISERSDAARGSASVLVRFSGAGLGSVCLRMSWTTDFSQQVIKGTWAVLGGTGRGGRLHDAGRFRGVQPAPFQAKGSVSLTGHPSLGARRAVPRGCGTINVPPEPKPIKATLTFDGFAASVGPPGPSAALVSQGTTVSDPALCRPGGGLYAVFTYAGPTSGVKFDVAVFGPGGTTQPKVALRPGRVSMLMGAHPKAGSYSFKGGLAPTGDRQIEGGGGGFSGDIQVSPGC